MTMNPYYTPLLIYREILNTNFTTTIQRKENFKNLTCRKYKEAILIEQQKITIQRRELFHKFLFELNKLIRFDKDIKDIYNLIIFVIDSYCSQYITYYKFDNITYNIIFEIIENVKIDKKTIELLNKIFIKCE